MICWLNGYNFKTKTIMIKIKIISGSTRPKRFNIQPCEWIYEEASKRDDFEVEFIDLKEVGLPFLDEPIPPSQGKYQNEHTKKWSTVIDEADGFIMVTPEYNHSYAPVLKNAIDFLFKEWHYKPVTFISYGSLAGGARSVEHLRGVCAEVKMYDLREHILFPNYWNDMDNGTYQFTAEHSKQANEMFDSLAFWAKIMKEARVKLAEQKEVAPNN